MPKELNQDTLDALESQGGVTDAENTPADINPSTEDNLPDIEIRDPNIDPAQGDPDGTPDDGDGGVRTAGEGDSELNGKVSKTLTEAGYTEEALTERLTADGGISDEFIQELKEKIDPDFVDAHVGRLRAEFELQTIKASDEFIAKNEATQKMNDFIYDTVGGKDNFSAMGKFLKERLDDSELGALNAKLSSGNEAVVKEGLEAAVKKYNNIRGMGGKLMEGDAGNPVEAPTHITKQEYSALMRTDKYKTDPLYARKVDQDRLKTRAADKERYGNGVYFGYHPDKGRYSL